MKKMEKARLLKLAKFLREYVKSNWFNLSVWAEDGFVEKKCGTAACALGWAPSCFPRSGLKLMGKYNLIPEYNGHDGIEAGEAFFGLSSGEARYLFDPTCYPKSHRGRLYVAKRIESFVKTNGKNCDQYWSQLAPYSLY